MFAYKRATFSQTNYILYHLLHSHAHRTHTMSLALQGKLSVFELDEVKGALGCALREERVALMDDISYLTALLTDETDMQVRGRSPSYHQGIYQVKGE